MKEIILTKGKVALVDDEDFDSLSKTSWYAHSSKYGRTGYTARGTMKNYKNKLFLMHRQILGLSNPKISVDHIDGNGLNNQKSNLRICTHGENMRNTRKRVNCSSRFKGISWNKDRKKWDVRANLNKKVYRVGRYDNEVEAALAYNVTASFLFGEFASLNKV